MAGGFADALERALPREVVDRLENLSTDQLSALVNTAGRELAGKVATGATAAGNEIQAAVDDQEMLAAMCAIVVTCARDGGASTPTERRQQLYAMGVEDEALQSTLLPLLATETLNVACVLEHSSFDFAHVVDVSWRLDYVLRSSSAGSIHEPLCFVQLKVQSPSASNSRLQTLSFSCSVEELRSLVYKVQEAANEVEKLLAGTPSQLRTSA